MRTLERGTERVTETEGTLTAGSYDSCQDPDCRMRMSHVHV